MKKLTVKELQQLLKEKETELIRRKEVGHILREEANKAYEIYSKALDVESESLEKQVELEKEVHQLKRDIQLHPDTLLNGSDSAYDWENDK